MRSIESTRAQRASHSVASSSPAVCSPSRVSSTSSPRGLVRARAPAAALSRLCGSPYVFCFSAGDLTVTVIVTWPYAHTGSSLYTRFPPSTRAEAMEPRSKSTVISARTEERADDKSSTSRCCTSRRCARTEGAVSSTIVTRASRPAQRWAAQRRAASAVRTAVMVYVLEWKSYRRCRRCCCCRR